MDYNTGLMSTIFVIIMAVLALSMVAIFMSPETVETKSGVLSSLKRSLLVPSSARAFLPAAVAVFVGTWGLGGFYQAFAATTTADYLHIASTVMAAIVFAAFNGPIILGGLLSNRFDPFTAQKVGMAAFFVCIVAAVGTYVAGWTIPFLVATISGSLASGVAFTTTIQGLVSRATSSERSGFISTLYLIAYIGAAVPSIVVGRVGNLFSLGEIGMGYVILALVATVLTWLFANRAAHHMTESNEVIIEGYEPKHS